MMQDQTSFVAEEVDPAQDCEADQAQAAPQTQNASASQPQAESAPQPATEREAAPLQVVASAAPAQEPTRSTSSNPPQLETPRVLVIGVGGAGGNAVNTMIRRRLEGVEYLAANTDAQALEGSLAQARLQLGLELTRGLGAGGKPETGRKSVDESAESIRRALSGAHMCFIAAGMGGGTGTGAAPAIAEIARELGVLTVGVVSKPFDFEGPKRRDIAQEGVAALTEAVDTIIVIPNQNLFRVANENTTLTDAFLLADEVLYQGVKGVTDLMFKPGLVNLDFSDVRAVIDGMGSAMMGSGEAEGENRATLAAERAVENPLLDDVTLRGAKGVLINITGGPDMKLFEVDAAAKRVRQDADADADIFFGSTIEEEMAGRIRVSVVATGVRKHHQAAAAGAAASAARPAPATVAASDGPRAQETVAAAPAAASAPAPAAAPVAPSAAAQNRIEPRLSAPSVPPLPLSEDDAAAPGARIAAPQAPQAAPQAAAPAEQPVAGSRGVRSDELVRKMTEAMVRNVDKSAAAVSDAVSSTPAPGPTGREAPKTLGSGQDAARGGAARPLSRPARENGRLEIPSFLRRTPN